MTKDIYIFDIDGTLANNTHRQVHLLKKKKDWDSYSALMHKDLPIEPVKKLFNDLLLRRNIFICTGRQEKDRDVTRFWLEENICSNMFYPRNFHTPTLFMRKTGDYRDDFIVKEEMLDNILKMGYNPVAVFDDRYKVVNMWRDRGLFVFDVNQTRSIF